MKTKHAPHPCRRVGGLELRYNTKNWSDKFICPVCGNTRRFSLNFLGNRRVPHCYGDQIKAGDKLEYSDYRAAIAKATGG